MKYSILFFLMFTVYGCDMLQTPVLENPNDPSSPYFQAKASSDLTIEELSSDTIRLSWKNNSNNLMKNIIQRSIDGLPFTDLAEKSGTDSVYFDTDITINHSYSYRISAISKSGLLSLSDVIKARYEKSIKVFHHAEGVTAFFMNQDGRFAAYKTINNEITVFDLNNEAVLSSFYLNTNDIAFSPDGNYLVTGNNDKRTIEIRKIRSGDVVKEVGSFNNNILKLEINPVNSAIACIDETSDLRILNFDTGNEIFSFSQFGSNPARSDLKFSNNGRYLALYNPGNRTILLRETEKWNIEQLIKSDWMGLFYFTIDNRNLIFTYGGHSIVIRDLATGSNKRWNLSEYNSLVFSPDEKMIAVYENNGVEIFSIRDFEIQNHLATILTDNNLADVALSNQGKVLTLDGNTFKIWDTAGNWISNN